MSTKRRDHRRRRAAGGDACRFDVLEARTLLSTTTETFTGPSLSDLIALARAGQNTAPAGINRMVQALETQLTSGPLADLSSGAVDGNGFVTEVQSLESSFEQNVDQQLNPEFRNVDQLIKLQGQRIVAGVISLNQQNTVGLLSTANAAIDVPALIKSLTSGPIFALNTPLRAFVTITTDFETQLSTIAQSLSSSASPSLTSLQAAATVSAESNAYLADVYAGLKLPHPNVSNAVAQEVIKLQVAASNLAQGSSSTPQADLESAITAFDTAVLDKSGIFGPSGVVSQATAAGVFTPNPTVSRSSTSIGSVSGTATNGTASVTATLTSAITGQGISTAVVYFTLDGAFVGTTATDSNGVATLTGVTTSDAVGTDTGGVVATYAGATQLQFELRERRPDGQFDVNDLEHGLGNRQLRRNSNAHCHAHPRPRQSRGLRRDRGFHPRRHHRSATPPPTAAASPH